MDRSRRRIYLDHAATRFPKPAVVLETMRDFSQHEEAAVGRGAYRASQEAGGVVKSCRQEVLRWLGAQTAGDVSFHNNGTTALNAAILGCLRNGDHVVTTAAEHNSVLRPLHHLASQGVITWTLVPVDSSGRVSVDAVLEAIETETSLVAVTSAANVNGATQPIAEIGSALSTRFAEDKKPLLLCDAAQTFGHLPLSVVENSIDLLAAPGHKGGCGPLGTGFLYANQRAQKLMVPTVFGGTGSESQSLEMPTDFPSMVEPGNLNVPAIAGWLAGLRERRGDQEPEAILRTNAVRLAALAGELYELLESIEGVDVIGKPELLHLPVASITVGGMPASDVAMILDHEFGIEVRSGFHCAALIHEAIGSPSDGTLRISAAEDTTEEELGRLQEAIKAVAVSIG